MRKLTVFTKQRVNRNGEKQIVKENLTPKKIKEFEIELNKFNKNNFYYSKTYILNSSKMQRKEFIKYLLNLDGKNNIPYQLCKFIEQKTYKEMKDFVDGMSISRYFLSDIKI